jgi:hypothetical protein
MVQRPAISRRTAILWLTLLGVGHTVAALFTYTPLSAYLLAPDIDAFDFCCLDQILRTGRETFAASGRLWGYDPYQLGGTVETFIWNSEAFLQVLAVALPFLTAGRVLKLATVLTAALLPVLIYLGWRGFGYERRQSLIGAFVGVMWFRLSEAFIFWAIGMTVGWFVYPLSFLGLGLLSQYLRDDSRGGWLFLVAPLAALVHKTAVVTFGLPALAMVLMARPLPGWRKWVCFVGVGLVTVLVNLFWIVPVLRYLPMTNFDLALSYWTNLDPWAFARDLTNPSARLGVFDRPNLWGDMLFRDLAVLGFLVALFRRRKIAHWPQGFAFGVVLIGLMTYGGSFVSFLHPFDPSRYVPYFTLLMSFATTALAMGRTRLWTPAAGLLVAALLALNFLPSAGRLFLERRIHAAPSAELDRMADWINRLPGTGRVHVETFSSFHKERPSWDETYGRISMRLPSRTQRPLLGGHYSGLFTLYNHANFFNGVWQGKPLAAWTATEFGEQLRLYNVEYLLTWSEAAKLALRGFNDVVEPLPAPAPFHGWRVKQPGSYFLEGSGDLVSWGYDRLEVVNPQPADGRVVLSFHWAPTLQARGAQLVPVPKSRDPVPFIGLVNPADRVVITNGGAW